MLLKELKTYLDNTELVEILNDLEDDENVEIDDFTKYEWLYKKDDALFYKDNYDEVNLIPNLLINNSYETKEYTIFLIENFIEHFVIFSNDNLTDNILEEC